jgi:L-threonylcarbamoyladenylate synthase
MQRSLVITSLNNGGVGVLPTDTIYGVVASALNRDAVERLYRLKARTPTKPFIILIADSSDLEKFGIAVDRLTDSLINQLWPGPVSIILPCGKDEFLYLHRGTNTLAFRLPADEALRAFLRETGPLVAPSANPEGKEPATTKEEAEKYFGARVDFYIDAKPQVGPASTLVEIKNGKVVVLRQGSAIIPEELLA